MVLTIFAILFCTRLLYSFSENFETDINYNKNNTHYLIPANLPIQKSSYVKVGNNILNNLQNSTKKNFNKYQFIKPQLLYDGIWKNNINQIENFAKNDWSIDNNNCHLDVYGSNKFFNIKNIPIDGIENPVNGCANYERIIQRPIRDNCKFYPEPDMEDILGYRIA
jgi:hypothetical protein